MTTSTPTLITIKILASTAPNVKDVQAALAQFGTTLQYEAVGLVFNGTGLVPSSVAVPAASEAPQAVPSVKKGGRKPGAPKIEVTGEGKRKAQEATTEGSGKPISFEAGSDPAKIWALIRSGRSMTSTQIREKLGLGSNIVNTTVYRLKKAGMVRPMSHSAPNGDTLYTSTEWDAVPFKVVQASVEEPEGDVRDLISALEGQDDESEDAEEAF